MTQIINLPSLNTLTNQLVFVVSDQSDNNKTKKITLGQLVALSAGPQGPEGIQGAVGPSGPIGPSGPGANQTLNTVSTVTFSSILVTNTATGMTFGDGTVQSTAFKKSVRDLTEFSTGNISLTASEINAPILSGNPTVAGRNLYLPIASSNLGGIILIVRNRSSTQTFTVWGGLGNLGTIATNSAIQIACDGYHWFVV